MAFVSAYFDGAFAGMDGWRKKALAVWDHDGSWWVKVEFTNRDVLNATFEVHCTLTDWEQLGSAEAVRRYLQEVLG
jgi:hypothetical protein